MRKFLVAAMMIVGLLASSCSDYFDLSRPPQAPWSTVSEFERAPVGAYAGLFSGNQWNMAWVNERLVKSSMEDAVGFVSDATFGYTRATKEYNVYVERNFTQIYKVIATCNNALDFVQQNNGNPFPNATTADIENNVKRITGELYFIRAYSYYILITTFGHTYLQGGNNGSLDIPMPTSFAKSAQEGKNPKIGTTQQVYDLISGDLRRAKALLPLKFDPTKHHPSYEVRANRFAVSGILARTYLQKGAYDSARAECDFIIDQNNGEYDLSEEPIQAFNKSSLVRGREVIFYAPFFDLVLQPPNHLSVLNQTWSGTPTPWVETHMALSTVKRLNWMTNNGAGDTVINIEAKRDKRFKQLMTVRYPINKRKPGQAFESRAGVSDIVTIINNKYYRGPSGIITNVPLIRLPEIYLTRSILRFRAGDKSGAASDLNVVRSRSWDVSIGGAYPAVTAATITEQLINDERLIEMFNEGDRIDYFRGIKIPIPNGDRGPGTTDYASVAWQWYIPTLELNFNDQL